MSEAAPDDVAALRREMTELREAYQRLAEASSAREKEEAREDVAEAKADLDELARTMGIPRAKLDSAISDAKRAGEKEKLRPIIAELLDELVTDDEEGDDDAAKEEPAAEKVEKQAPPAKPAPDSAPVQPHWSERGIGELLR